MNYSFFIFFFFTRFNKRTLHWKIVWKKPLSFVKQVSTLMKKYTYLLNSAQWIMKKKTHFFCPQNICSRILASFKSNKNTCILWYLWLLKLFCQLLRIHHFSSCYVYYCGLYTRREITLKIKYYQIDNQYLVLCPLWEIVLPQCLWPWR